LRVCFCRKAQTEKAATPLKRDGCLQNSVEAAVSAAEIAREDTRHYTYASLLIVTDHLRRRFAYFNLGAHFLNLRGLLFQVCSENLHILVLLRDGGL